MVYSISSLVCVKVAVKRIIGGKWGPCSGQVCIGIDYLLVEEKMASTLVSIACFPRNNIFTLNKFKCVLNLLVMFFR